MATVKRRDNRGGKWEVRYRDPEGKQRTRLFARKVDADNFASTTTADIVRGTYVDAKAGRQTFESFADEWAKAQDWKGTTRDGWPYIRARLIPVLGGRRLSSIDLLTLQTARRTLAADYAHSTTTTTMAYAGMILRAAYTGGRIGRDPTKGFRAPKVRADEDGGKVGPDDVPTRAEALAILAGAPDRYRVAVALGLTGLRVGEVLGMSADRLELDKRTVTVDRQLQRVDGELVLTTPKSEKVRTIVVPGIVAVELRRHLRDHQGDGLLFRGRRGTPMMRRDQFYDSAWHPALRAAGLADVDESDVESFRFVFHSLRHFCASSLLAEGAPITAVAGHLGDTVETVSRTYAHWLRDDREVPAAVLDRVLAPASSAPNVRQASPAAL